MPKSHPEYERGFTDGFNSRQRDVEQSDVLPKAAEDALPFVESVAAHCHHNCGPEDCSAEGQRRAKQGRIIATALRKALGKEQ